jgi:hypothetical protein
MLYNVITIFVKIKMDRRADQTTLYNACEQYKQTHNVAEFYHAVKGIHDVMDMIKYVRTVNWQTPTDPQIAVAHVVEAAKVPPIDQENVIQVLAPAVQAYVLTKSVPDFYRVVINIPNIGAILDEARTFGMHVPTSDELMRVHTAPAGFYPPPVQNVGGVRDFRIHQPAQPPEALVGSLEPKSGLDSIASAMRADMPDYYARLQWQQNAMQSGGGKSRRKGRKGRKGRRKGRKSRKH